MEYSKRLSSFLRRNLIPTLLWLQAALVLGTQIKVSIDTPTLSPSLGSTNYQLKCEIFSFQFPSNRKLVWIKDDQVVSWNTRIQERFQVDFDEVTESQIANTISYELKFGAVTGMHNGSYKCLVANGASTHYTALASASIQLQIPYFPPGPWNPQCSPSGGPILIPDFETLHLSCTSETGYPEVSLSLQEGHNMLLSPLLQTETDTIWSSSKIVKDRRELVYPFNVTSCAHNGATFECVMTGTGQFSNMVRKCTIGPLDVLPCRPQIIPHTLRRSVGQDALFTCALPTTSTINRNGTINTNSTINWFTYPATPSSRYEINTTTKYVPTNTTGASKNTTSYVSTFMLKYLTLFDDWKKIHCWAKVQGVNIGDSATLSVTSHMPFP